jgi:prepilin-type N-terminal cleavage/methylation domain-containing protein
MTAPPTPRDEGYTLVETLITILVVSIVLAAAFPVLPVFFRENNIVQNTYQSVDQLVLASEVSTRYIHEAVSPSPTANPIQTANANSTTFYANTGNANGPQEVVTQVATVGSTRTFQVNLYTPTANSCPGINPSGTACTYAGSTQSYLLINNLTNGTGGSPVFTYTLQGGEVCAGPPPGSSTTTLKAAAVAGATTLSVNTLTSAIGQGDTIYVGSGGAAQTVTATVAAASGASSITVSALPSAATNGSSVYDSALTTVPNTLPTTLKSSASSGATTLSVASLPSAVTSGDTIVVGTGTSAVTTTATANVAVSATTTSIPVTALPSAQAANLEVYDSSCSATQVSEIEAIALSLQTTKNPGGQPTGYQSLAYFLSPQYSSSVG